MRVLFLTCHLPYPPHSGGRLREHELLRRVTREHDVHVCAVTKTLAEDEEAVGDIPWRHAGVTLFPAAGVEQVAGVAPQVARHRSFAAAAGIRRLLAHGDFELVHVEGFYLWQHVAGLPAPATVLAEQNVEWQLFAQQGRSADARLTEHAEVAAWRDADVLAAITAEDQAVMRARTGRPVRLVPDGADHLLPAPHRAPARGVARRGRRIVMVANFAYAPNVAGARWLCQEVMPRLRSVVPGVELQLVGAAPPHEVLALAADDVRVTGRVPEVGPYLDAAEVVVCPLRFGGGVKVKVLEGLAFGKAIVGTSIATQGLNGAAAAVTRADEPVAFADAVARLLLDPAARARAEAAARAAAVTLPRWDAAAAALSECWERAARLSVAAA